MTDTHGPGAETVEVAAGTHTVRCDGGDGLLGHPAVFLPLEDSESVICPYCSRRFVRPAGAPVAPAH